MKFYLFAIILIGASASCKSTKNNVDCIGEAKKDCICTMQYEPVCGCDGKTYGNPCLASCAGVKSFKKGACPEKNP